MPGMARLRNGATRTVLPLYRIYMHANVEFRILGEIRPQLACHAAQHDKEDPGARGFDAACSQDCSAHLLSVPD